MRARIAVFAFVFIAECGGKTDDGTLSPQCPTWVSTMPTTPCGGP